jgi:hypothetical protein
MFDQYYTKVEVTMTKRKATLLFLLVVLIVLVLPVLGGSFGTSFRTHGVEATGVVTGLKKAKDSSATITMQIAPVSSGAVTGILFCGRSTSSSSPASVTTSNRTKGHEGDDDDKGHRIVPVPNVQVPSFSSAQSIAGSAINKNGQATVDVIADPSLSGVTSCPSHMVPLDFVPVEFIATMTATSASRPGKNLAKTKYKCVLPNPSTLQYLEQRQYSCTKISDESDEKDD